MVKYELNLPSLEVHEQVCNHTLQSLRAGRFDFFINKLTALKTHLKPCIALKSAKLKNNPERKTLSGKPTKVFPLNLLRRQNFTVKSD